MHVLRATGHPSIQCASWKGKPRSLWDHLRTSLSYLERGETGHVTFLLAFGHPSPQITLSAGRQKDSKTVKPCQLQLHQGSLLTQKEHRIIPSLLPLKERESNRMAKQAPFHMNTLASISIILSVILGKYSALSVSITSVKKVSQLPLQGG